MNRTSVWVYFLTGRRGEACCFEWVNMGVCLSVSVGTVALRADLCVAEGGEKRMQEL